MAVSRWERNSVQPSGTMLLKLGTLAHKNARVCWDFWELAGLTPHDVAQVMPVGTEGLRQTHTVLQFVKAGARHKVNEESLVAIPLSELVASAGKDEGSSYRNLQYASSRHAIVAPKLWCPNPQDTICMRVKGNSMEPILHHGNIIVVDQAQTDKSKLSGEIIVAHHKKFGLVVSRFWKLKSSETLLPDNRAHDPAQWSPSWKVVGKVLWWIGQPA